MESFRSKSKWHGLEEDSDDYMKMEYFSLGISSVAHRSYCDVLYAFLSTYHDAGPLNELSKEYYPMFRMIFFVLCLHPWWPEFVSGSAIR